MMTWLTASIVVMGIDSRIGAFMLSLGLLIGVDYDKMAVFVESVSR